MPSGSWAAALSARLRAAAPRRATSRAGKTCFRARSRCDLKRGAARGVRRRAPASRASAIEQERVGAVSASTQFDDEDEMPPAAAPQGGGAYANYMLFVLVLV